MGDGGGVLSGLPELVGRGGRAPARGPVHLPDRRGAARALRRRADAAAARRAGERAVARARDAAADRRRGQDLGRGRRAVRRRRDPPLRVAGRDAGRARAHDHRLRRRDHLRAGGQAGAREAARDDRDADGRGPPARPGRAADGRGHRSEQARTTCRATSSSAGSWARIRTPARSRWGPTYGPGRSCGCTRATPRAPTATCAPHSARGGSRSAGGRRRARS